MHYFYILLLLSSSLFAQVHYAKVQPYKVYTISSNVNGIVIKVKRELEGKVSNNATYLKVDDSLDKKDLKNNMNQIKLLQKSLLLIKKSMENELSIIEKKEKNYTKIKDLSVKSDVEKDKLYFDLMLSKNTLINIQNNQINTQKQIDNLRLKNIHLKKSIKDKSFKTEGLYIYKIYVHEGEMLNIGKAVAKLYDLSRAKVTLFLSKNEINTIKSKTIYINNKSTLYKLDKIWKIADENHISSYRAEIYLDNVKSFSDIAKVEFKSE